MHNEKSNVVIINSMLNNIYGRGLSKSKKVVLNFTGANSSPIVNETDKVLDGKP